MKLAVTAGLLAWVLARAELGAIASALGTAKIGWVLAAFSLHFVGLLISALRWQLLLRSQGAAVPLGFLARSLLVGTFFNNFLPSTVGGDLMRVRDTAGHAGSGAGSLAIILVERASGILVLGFFVLAAPLSGGLGDGRSSSFAIAAAGVLLFGFVLFALAMRPRPLGALARLVRSRAACPTTGAARGVLVKATCLVETLETLARAPGTLRTTFLLALLLQANVILHFWCVAQSLDLGVRGGAFLLVVPVATVLLLAPVSINGIGAREAVFAFLLGCYGVSTSQALAFSWIAYGTVLGQGLLGGLIYALRRRA
jgi:hypothetical protein